MSNPHRTVLTSLCGFLLALALATGAVAQKMGSDFPAESAVLQVAPDRIEEEIEPGQSKHARIDVFNLSRRPVTVRPEVESIQMVGTDGSLRFFSDERPYRIESFVKIDRKPFRLGVGEARQVAYRIDVPQGAWPGGYFGSILFRIEAPKGTGGIAVRQSGRVGSLLVLNVLGQSERRGQIVSFRNATESILAKRRTFRSEYANTGSTEEPPLGIAYRPTGTLTIKNALGMTVARRAISQRLVLPGGRRAFETTVERRFWLGPYTAELSIKTGNEGQADVRVLSFWAVSWAALLLLAAAIVLLAALLFAYSRYRLHRQIDSESSGDG